MNQKTAMFVLELLDRHKGDKESTARYMRDSLRIAGIQTCRGLIAEAYDYAYPEEVEYNSEPHVVS